MFCYNWNNGIAMRAVDDDYIPQEGEFLFANSATTEQLNVAFPLYNNGVPILSIDEQITVIEIKYNIKFEALEKRLNNVLLSDGINQEAKTIILQNEYRELSDQKETELLEILGGI